MTQGAQGAAWPWCLRGVPFLPALSPGLTPRPLIATALWEGANSPQIILF